jgi:excisionase family DNA binding protein
MLESQPSITEPLGEYLTVNEVAAALKLNPQTVRNWITDGQLPALRVEQRRVRIRRPDLDALLSQGPTDPTTEPTPAAPQRESVGDSIAELRDQIKGLRARVELLERAQDA